MKNSAGEKDKNEIVCAIRKRLVQLEKSKALAEETLSKSGISERLKRSIKNNIRLFELEKEKLLLKESLFRKGISNQFKEKIENRIRIINEEIDHISYEEGLEDDEEEYEDDEDEELEKACNLLHTIKPRVSFNDVILSKPTKDDILSALSQIKNKEKIFDKWGLKDTIHYGKGTVLLFVGLPGTGKTLVAEAVAKNLKKNLSMINYGRLLSKWQGDTEKQTSGMFEEARKTGNILLIDEADALISRRGDADGYASSFMNPQKSHFLQELENFEGIVIMTTNMASNLDKALERRICATVLFEMPGPDQRMNIWKLLAGKKMPLAQDVDFSKLAKKYEFSGGHIKNAMLGAARIAAMKNSRKVRMEHFEKAAEQVLKGQGILQHSYLSKNEKQCYMG